MPNALTETSSDADTSGAFVLDIHLGDDRVFATSREVARVFGKEVKHVHEAIRTLIKMEPALSLNFRPFEINDLTGTSVHHYDLDRDAVTLLVMGFTGKKAIKFKRRYIEAFNEIDRRLMEAETKRAAPVATQSYSEALRAAADAYELGAKQDRATVEPDPDALVLAARAWADARERQHSSGRDSVTSSRLLALSELRAKGDGNQ